MSHIWSIDRSSFLHSLLYSFFFVFTFFGSSLSAQERAIHHGPIGVTGEHYHKKNGVMISIRQMRMLMGDNRDGTKDLSDAEVIELDNPYYMGDMSTKLSVVPKKMLMDMTMLGAMYAPSDSLSLMGMMMLTNKKMDLNTYQGVMSMNGMMMNQAMTNRAKLGLFTTSAFGLSSLSVSGLIKLYEINHARLHAELGMQRSIGESDVMDEVLTPMNMRQDMILPYGMQIGDRSTSLIAGLTYVHEFHSFVYGNQLRLKNKFQHDLWSFGDTLSLTGWVQKELSRKTSLSLRIAHHSQGTIKGRNSLIMAPVQTANPENYGGKIIELSVGINQLLNIFPGNHSDRIGLEVTHPVYQNLNGPQMKHGLSINLGYQKSLK